MKKLFLTGVLAALAAPAFAATTMVCNPPVLTVPETGDVLFRVACEGVPAAAGVLTLAPAVEFSGAFNDKTTTPYRMAASYQLNALSPHSVKVGVEPRPEQMQSGELTGSLTSAASLPAQLAAQIHWDGSTGVLSIEERPGLWRSVKIDSLAETVAHAGYSSTPVVEGRATAQVPLGAKLSRFAGKEPVEAQASLALIEGQLEVMLGATQKANEAKVQDALKRLDAAPKDLTRAWTLAALATYLDRPEEVLYAERKVAAAAPQYLDAFRDGLSRITPYSLTTLQPK